MFRPALVVCLCFAPMLAQANDFMLSGPTVKSDATLTEEQVLNGFGCSGKNLSPALKWTAGPEGTKSYAVTMYDPDAPTGSGWWHWVVYNIPAGITELAAGAGNPALQRLPAGAVEGRTDFGNHEFGGACPPKGDRPHRYIFTVHALNTERLDAPADASAALIGFMLHSSSLGKASLAAKYGR